MRNLRDLGSMTSSKLLFCPRALQRKHLATKKGRHTSGAEESPVIGETGRPFENVLQAELYPFGQSPSTLVST